MKIKDDELRTILLKATHIDERVTGLIDLLQKFITTLSSDKVVIVLPYPLDKMSKSERKAVENQVQDLFNSAKTEVGAKT